MDWTSWLDLSPSEFLRRLRRRLSKGLGPNDFISLYNVLLMRAQDDPHSAAAICDAIIPLLMKRRPRDGLVILEVAARAHFLALNPTQAFAHMKAMVEADAADVRDDVLELAVAIKDDVDRFGISIDQRPWIYAEITGIFASYDEWEQVAEVHLEAAMLYSRHNAAQAAYRSLEDVERIVRKLRSVPLLAKLLKALVAVGCEEGDFPWAIKHGRRALRLFRLRGEQPAVSLLSNLGVALMNENENDEARLCFEEALKQQSKPGPLRGALQTNHASCLRRLGRFEDSRALLGQVEQELGDDCAADERLELEMSWARLAAATEDETLLAARLGRAAVQLDAMLGEILRLHHRRGLRERYLTPIESLLRTLPVEGPASDVLLPLAATRGNALGDWLAICAWAEEVASHTAVPSKLKYELTQVLRALRDFGVPHLYGFREKYDDPWSPSVGGGLWDRLSNVAAQLAAHGIASPVAQATNAHCAELCRQRLNEGHCLMATTYAGETAMLWVLSGDRYRRVEFEHEPSGHCTSRNTASRRS
jgi:tetratricopeptide (TPR) repeat protein